MAEQRYEYVAVRAGFTHDEKKVTERINSVAEHGWRLVTVLNGTNGADQFLFERAVDV